MTSVREVNTITRILTIGFLFSALFIRGCGLARAEVPEIVLQTIALESASESLLGQAAVANTIQTRSERAKISLQSVVMRRMAFSSWNDRNRARKWLKRYFDDSARQMAQEAWLMGKAMPYRFTHYHHVGIKPYWAKGHTPRLVIGKHQFYEGIN